jgi:hypothetical protein
LSFRLAVIAMSDRPGGSGHPAHDESSSPTPM